MLHLYALHKHNYHRIIGAFISLLKSPIVFIITENIIKNLQPICLICTSLSIIVCTFCIILTHGDEMV